MKKWMQSFFARWNEQRKIWIYVVCSAVPWASCQSAAIKEHLVKTRYTQYGYVHPGPEWKQVSMSGIDVALIHPDGASILLNSDCKGKKDMSLRSLTIQLVIGMTEERIVSQQSRPFLGRGGLETVLYAQLDGVPRQIKAFVAKKDGCVYDLILASSVEQFSTHEQAYETLLQAISTEVDHGKRAAQ